jgi:hypothetical protein
MIGETRDSKYGKARTKSPEALDSLVPGTGFELEASRGPFDAFAPFSCSGQANY